MSEKRALTWQKGLRKDVVKSRKSKIIAINSNNCILLKYYQISFLIIHKLQKFFYPVRVMKNILIIDLSANSIYQQSILAIRY